MNETPYRLPGRKPPAPPLPPDPYLRAWQRLRMWRLLTLAGVVSWLAMMFIVLPLTSRPPALVALPIVALLVMSVSGVSWFACPKCGEAFGSQHWFWGPHWPSIFFRRRCLHCGIAMGTRKGSAPPLEDAIRREHD